ncbi:helix-turn-helix transcriptional regulator [Melioribacter sp. Ez-97]|uniref:helix-turn-helix transcriptional regulator n=1 Tax=Melioribacter sp. Ez-97 TaxID=3423434 RepID=UPI003EDB5B7A
MILSTYTGMEVYHYYYYLLILLITISVLPDLNIKYKSSIIFSTLFYLSIDPDPLDKVIAIILLILFLCFYFASTFVKKLITEKKAYLYLLALIAIHFIIIASKYLYYTDNDLLKELYPLRLSANIILVILITIAGPDYSIPLNLKIFDKLAKKRLSNIESPLTFISELKKLGLTNREIEILKYIGDGYTSKEIAQILNLSKKTIDYYRSVIKDKLNVSTKSELMQIVKDKNLEIEQYLKNNNNLDIDNPPSSLQTSNN